MQAKNFIFVSIFLMFISFPAINTILKLVPDIKSSENRQFVNLQKIYACSLEQLPRFLDKFLIENLSIRNRAIQFYNRLNLFVFKSSPVVIKAIVGKYGWYFMAGEEIKTFNGTALFTADELQKYKNLLLQRKSIIEKYNSKLLFVIVPNKSNIYPEYMPDHVIKTNNLGYGKQLLKYLSENNLPVIDLYSALNEAKNIHEVYYHTDNHWNDFGAFTASNAILKQIKKYFPIVEPLSIDSFQIEIVKDKPGNIAKMFSVENDLSELNYLPLPKTGFRSKEIKSGKYNCPTGFAYPEEFEFTRILNNDSLPVILIIRDSFGKKPFPYIAEQSKKCISIFDAWNYGLNEDIIKEEKPDIVLYLIVESNLKNLLKN